MPTTFWYSKTDSQEQGGPSYAMVLPETNRGSYFLEFTRVGVGQDPEAHKPRADEIRMLDFNGKEPNLRIVFLGTAGVAQEQLRTMCGLVLPEDELVLVEDAQAALKLFPRSQ